jgi:acyl carrier protein
MKARTREYIVARGEVLARVRRLLIDGLDVKVEVEAIDPDTPLFGSGLGLDSIDAVELALLLEEHFGVKWEDGPMGRAGMRTVNSVVDMIMRHRSQAA